MAAQDPSDSPAFRNSFSLLGARRLFLLVGISLILTGMIFGDIFAIFVLHQNAARVGAHLAGAAYAALHGDAAAAQSSFESVGMFLENRGTKVDTHVHMIGFGYLALFLAIVEPWLAFSAGAKRRIAWTFVLGAWLLPTGVFLIHYVGLAYSPLQSIGWASIFADFGGLLVLVSTLACLAGLWKYFRSPARATQAHDLLMDQSASSRLLSTGGLLLILLGFAGGAYYATFDLYRHQARDFRDLSQMTAAAASDSQQGVDQALADYGQLQGDKAVKIAAHAHSIEFGLLAMMLAFFQPYIHLRESSKRRWALMLLFGSLLLPVCVFLEMRFGLLAGGLADAGGVLVIFALLAMWIGILRYTGQVDAADISYHARNTTMSRARRILLVGGIALAALGMSHGIWYAVFAEHQALAQVGGSLSTAFSGAAQRDPGQVAAALSSYRESKYAYERQVDVHSHWIGLAMVLIVLGLCFNQVSFPEKLKTWLAVALLVGAILFPLGVLLQVMIQGPLPKILAISGSALAIASLGLMALGFARRQFSMPRS